MRQPWINKVFFFFFFFYYVKDAPEVSFEWSHLPRPQDFVYVLKS